jgi:undecaprenyl-diphosphatase
VVNARLRRIERFTGRALVGLLAVVAAGVGFGVLLLLVRVGWRPLESVDHGSAAAVNGAVSGHHPWVTVLLAISALGGPAALWWLVTVGAVALLIRRQVALAVYLVVAGLGALALDPTLKLLVGRLRPVVAHPVAYGGGNSFPSGHALGSAVAYGALLLVFLPAVPRRRRGLATGVCVAVVAAVGLSRIALGVHYVSDVVAGWLLGVAWLGVTGYAFRVWRREEGRAPRPVGDGLAPEAAGDVRPSAGRGDVHPWRAAAQLVVGFVLVLGALFGLGTLLTAHAPDFDEAVPRWFFAHHTPSLDRASHFWSQAGNTHAVLAVGLVVAPLAVAYVRRWRPAVFLVVTMFGELVLFLTLSATVDRPRPRVTQLDGHLPTSSFPSGHVAATTCLYGAIAVLVVPRTRGWPRWLAVVPAVAMPALVGLSRIYRGEHHPLDVLGGVLLGLLWLAVVTVSVRPDADLARAGPAAGPGDPGRAEVTAGRMGP